MDWYFYFLVALAPAALGALWYSPLLFGKTWMQLMGLTDADVKDGSKSMGTAYLGWVVTAFILVWVGTRIGLDTMTQWSAFGALLWAGFSAPTALSAQLWSKSPSRKLWLINSAYELASIKLLAVLISLIV